jgi:hypothetical protein
VVGVRAEEVVVAAEEEVGEEEQRGCAIGGGVTVNVCCVKESVGS